MYFGMNGEKISILLIKGAQQCASKIFIVTEMEQKSTGSRPTYPESESPSTGRLRLRLHTIAPNLNHAPMP